MKAWIALGLLSCGFATPAWAQSGETPVFADDDAQQDTNDGYPNQGNYPAVGCAGGCPQGMVCSPDGVCEQAPSCAGGCPQGMVCSPDGVCEAGAPPPPPPMCNCPTGFACTPAGTCMPQATVTRLQPRAPDPEAANRARRRSTFGFVSSGITLALGITAGVIRSVENDNGCDTCFHGEMPVLFGAALYHGLAGIFTYGGSRAARRAGGRGNGFLRAAGWITWIGGLFGLVVGGAIAAVDGSEPSGFIYGSSVVAALGPLLWAVDARIGARQADELAAQQPQARRWAPSLGVLREGTGIVGGTLGAAFEL